MKRCFGLIFICAILSTIALIPRVQAHNFTQQNWEARQIDHPVFTQEYSSSGYPKTTVTTGQSRSRIPSPMAGKSNLQTVLQNYKSVPVPNLRTGTVQDFARYFSTAELSEDQILDWHAAYMSDSFVALAKQLPNYDQKLNKLQRAYNKQNKLSEWLSSKFGAQPKGFKKRLNELCSRRVRELEIAQAARAQAIKLAQIEQARQKSQVIVHQSWTENFELLQQDVSEWQELSDIFLEHKFGDSTRLQKRIAILSQLSANNSNNSSSVSNSGANSNSNFINHNYNISPEVNTVLRDTGLNSADYTSCYGNQFQQLIHQENLDQLQQLGTLSPLSPIFYHKLAITECVDSARAYNQAGLVHDSIKVTDMCWAFLDYGKAICEGVAQGLIMVAKDLVDHPEQALLLAVAGEYVLAYQIAKVAYDVAKIGITTWQDPNRGQEEWDSYLAPVTELVSALENNEIVMRDALKTGTMLAVGCHAQGKLSSSLGKLCNVAKTNALIYLKNNPHLTPQLYMSTPDGKIFKATNKAVKLTGSERRKLREQRAATQITEFLTKLSDENFNKAVAYATTKDKFDHFFEKPRHKLDNLLSLKNNNKKAVIEAVIQACVGKIPASGKFKNIPVNVPIGVSFITVYVRGCVIDGAPMLGTIFIK